MKRNVLNMLPVLSLFGMSSLMAAAQDTDGLLGKPLMVVSDTTELKTGTQVVGTASLGDVLEASKVNGEWLWIPAVGGWIKSSTVVEADKAVDYLSGAISQNPNSEAYRRRATAHLASGNAEKGINDLTTAIELDAKNLRAINDRGNAYRRQGELDKSIADFNTLVTSGGPHPVAYTNRAMTQIEKRDYQKAIADATQAIGVSATYAPAFQIRAAAKEAVGDFAGAVQDLGQAIKVDPNFDLAYNNLAWIYATAPDSRLRNGPKAVELATKANEFTGHSDLGYLDTLAAANAEAGNMAEAVKWGEKAIEAAAQEPERKKAIEARVALYKAGNAYHRSAQ